MATVSMASNTNTQRPSRHGNVKTPYLMEVDIDIEDVITTKGSALAASDVIEVMNIPAGTLVMAAGFGVVTATTGTATNVLIDFGVTGGDVDRFVDGFDLDGASAGDYSAVASGNDTMLLVTSADTLDLLIETMTGTLLTGELRVWALCVDVTDTNKGSIAALGS